MVGGAEAVVAAVGVEGAPKEFAPLFFDGGVSEACAYRSVDFGPGDGDVDTGLLEFQVPVGLAAGAGVVAFV